MKQTRKTKKSSKIILSILALYAASLLFSSRTKGEDKTKFNINFFPYETIQTISMADQDIYQTQLKISEGSEEIYLAKKLPLVSFGIEREGEREVQIFDNKTNEHQIQRIIRREPIFSTSLVSSRQGRIIEEEINYKTKIELILNSSYIDNRYSDGNKLYLIGSFTKEDFVSLESLAENLLLISQSIKNDRGFSLEAWIITNNELFKFRSGIDNLFGTKKPNLYLSTSWEFPLLQLQESEILRNLKISSYLSTYIKLPMDHSQNSNLIGQLGIKAEGESRRALALYGQLYYDQKSWIHSIGAKLDW